MYHAEILADSLSPEGVRLTTFELTLPRIVLAEFNTHRMLSRNSASSRAIPVSASIKSVEEDPFIPEVFGSHQKGMVEGDPLDGPDQKLANHYWNGALDAACDYAVGMEQLNVYKGLANRLLEPFKWHTIIATATDWSNYFALRTAANAQAEIRIISEMMQELYESQAPWELQYGQWHLPLVSDKEVYCVIPGGEDEMLNWNDEENWEYWRKVSIGRCARVSFNRQHDASDPDGDVKRHDMLLENRHLSPFEHAARPFSSDEWALVYGTQNTLYDIDTTPFETNLQRQMEYAGNLRGWWSARMDVPNQDDYGKVLASSS